MFAVIGRGLYADVDPKRFGNIVSAMLTLFQLLTLDDWFYIYTDAIAKDPGKFNSRSFFCIVIKGTTYLLVYADIALTITLLRG